MNKQLLTYRVGEHIFCLYNHSTVCIEKAIPSLSSFCYTPAAGEKELFELQIIGEAYISEGTSTHILQEISFEWEDAQCLIHQLTEDSYLIYITPNGESEAYVMKSTDNFSCSTVYLPYAERSTVNFVFNNFLMMLYAFSGARYNTLLMHASVIVLQDKGYLFLGKSGTGKSTHTGLWLKHIAGCHLLNDDNPVVRINQTSNQVTVYGSPWSGKTPCYRNESIPVGAFVRLEQAPQNEIECEIPVRAFAALLPSCSCLKQDKGIYNGIVSTITALATTTPVFHLKCLPNQNAAEICQKTIVR